MNLFDYSGRRHSGTANLRKPITACMVTSLFLMFGCASDNVSEAVTEFRAVETGIGMAPDAFRPDPSYEAFLSRVQKKCRDSYVGPNSIDATLLSDPAFLDLTSRFFNGLISQQNYVDALSGGYDARPDAPGIRCILQQMPPKSSQPPSPVPPIIGK